VIESWFRLPAGHAGICCFEKAARLPPRRNLTSRCGGTASLLSARSSSTHGFRDGPTNVAAALDRAHRSPSASILQRIFSPIGRGRRPWDKPRPADSRGDRPVSFRSARCSLALIRKHQRGLNEMPHVWRYYPATDARDHARKYRAHLPRADAAIGRNCPPPAVVIDKRADIRHLPNRNLHAHLMDRRRDGSDRSPVGNRRLRICARARAVDLGVTA